MASPVASAAIRVVIADDHPLYRAALADLVGHDPKLEVVHAAEDGRNALDAVFEHDPDVVVLDMKMPELTGTEVASQIRERGSDARILFLSEYHTGELVTEAFEAGAAGYLAKSSGPAEIRSAIGRVAAGEVVLDAKLSDEVASAIRSRSVSAAPRLSPRELAVLHEIAAGHGAREIALGMNLAVPTVKTHLSHLYQKLGVKDRGAAVAEAMRRGLLD